MMLEGIRHRILHDWIHEVVEMCTPARVHICNGSDAEWQMLTQEMVKIGTLHALDQEKRPGCFLARSSPEDVARVEERTFICSENKEDTGPTNNWRAPLEMLTELKGLFQHCMHGRTLYVIPYCMGPLGAKMSRIGVEITDSPYVVASMRIMTRMGESILDLLEEDKPFVRGLHSVGKPLRIGEKDVPWPCNSAKTVIAHFPEKKSIWSFGSGYGGNALLGKKCFALRIASALGRKEGWLAEHMLIVGVTNPQGKKKYFAAAFPSACGKTNMAMMRAQLPGWKVECVGDDIAWMRFSDDGRLHAINPEAGFFGVAPGTSMTSNPSALQTCAKNSLFTNVALTADNDVWWEGLTKEPPEGLISWKGERWTPQSGYSAAHPNSRFTSPAAQCPVIDPAWQEPRGVPISAIIFGGRRATTVPLVYEALNWAHGVFMGCSVSSETTAAAAGEVGKLRHDPFAMLPFCGYNMGDYFGHWLQMSSKTTPDKLPRIYGVNWFRKGANGAYLWPGFSENLRVLKWIFERTDGQGAAVQTPIGYLPTKEGIDVSNLSITSENLTTLLTVDRAAYEIELDRLRTYLGQFGTHLPTVIVEQIDLLEKRLKA